ncbi:hypothetical protein [Streptomyces turgidiscabies]|uniref:hypothetical protein n=1 Tax=Streptomyces turgidiscabies TaxID=85558 RepID=UPI0038F7AAA6
MTNEQSPDFTPATPSEDVRLMQFGIHPDDLKPADFDGDPHSLALAVMREAAEHFSSPFEPADVSDEEINEKTASVFGEEFSEVPEEIEESDEESDPAGPDGRSGPSVFISYQFSLRLPLHVVSMEEATALWFFPERGDRERPAHVKLRSTLHEFFELPPDWWSALDPLVERRERLAAELDRRERLAAELDVRSARWRTAVQGPSSQVEGLGELHSFVLELPQPFDTTWLATCKRFSPDRPSGSGELLRSRSETLLVLFDSFPASTTTSTSQSKQRSVAVGEFQWRSLDRLRRWGEEVAEHLGERREVPRGDVGAVLWLAGHRPPSGSPGAAALVPVPEWLQPAQDHLPQLSELWESTLRSHLAREIKNACGK